MNLCSECLFSHADNRGSEWGDLCTLLPHIETSAVTGQLKPPYKRCKTVRESHVADPKQDDCDLWKPKKEVPEAIVKENIRGKSVTFVKNMAGDG
jgi:hypothetical protein